MKKHRNTNKGNKESCSKQCIVATVKATMVATAMVSRMHKLSAMIGGSGSSKGKTTVGPVGHAVRQQHGLQPAKPVTVQQQPAKPVTVQHSAKLHTR